jgi:hypothetical protein
VKRLIFSISFCIETLAAQSVMLNTVSGLTPGTNISFQRFTNILRINALGGSSFKWSLSGASQVGDSIRFIQGVNITLAQSGNTLTIAGPAGAGEANTALNTGSTGIGLFKQKSGVELQFKKLFGGTGISIDDNTNYLTISATGTGLQWSDTVNVLETRPHTAITFAPISHTQAISTITNLPDSLGGRYTKAESDALLSGKSPTGHMHTIANVTGVQDSISKKPDRSEVTALLATKQNIIQNIADTATYTQYSDTLGTGKILTKEQARTTYAPIGAGGGLPGYSTCKYLADTTKSTIALVSPTALHFDVVNGETRYFKFVLKYSCAALTTGQIVGLIFPAVTNASFAVSIFGNVIDGATTEPWSGTINSSGDKVTSPTVAVINVPYVIIIEGNATFSASGVFQVQWAPEAAAASTLKAGSMGMTWTY